MKDNQVYRQRLEESLQKLRTDLEAIAVFNETTGDWEVRTDDLTVNDVDFNEMADDAEEADERIATLAELETSYRNTERALQKIADGTYGICEISGEEIETARLDANPAARTCIAHREEEYDLPL